MREMGEWDEPVPQTSFAFAAQAPTGDEVTAAKKRARKPASKPAKRARSEPKASQARKRGSSEADKADPAAPRRSAAELAKQARDISVSEFFAKNRDRKSTRLNSSHSQISYAVFCLKKKNKKLTQCKFAV